MSQNKNVKMDIEVESEKKRKLKIFFQEQQGMQKMTSKNPQMIQPMQEISEEDYFRVRIIENSNQIQEQEKKQFLEKIQSQEEQIQKESLQIFENKVQINENQENDNNLVMGDQQKLNKQKPKISLKKNAKINKNLSKKAQKDGLSKKKFNQINENSAFASIIPKKKNQSHGKIQINQHSKQIKTQCLSLMNQILDNKIQDTVKKVFSTIVSNIRQNNSIIIALHFKKDQKDDLQKFIQKIEEFRFHASHELHTMHIQTIPRENVRDIALQIYTSQDNLRNNYDMDQGEYVKHPITGQEINLRSHLNVYVSKKITNLSPQNIHVFEKSIIQGHYAVILPTFQNLKIIDGQGILENQSEKYFFQAYSNKQVFIEFFYRCILSKRIMAYLPCQALKLIKMYDYYPISYLEGCKMFIYACQLFDSKCRQQNKPQKRLVELKQLVRIFNKTWRNLFGRFSQLNNQIITYNYQQLCYCFLDQKAIYNVNQAKILSLLSMYSVQQDLGYSQKIVKKIYQVLEEKFIQKLKKDQSLKYLAQQMEVFGQQREKLQIKKKKNQRDMMLGFGSSSSTYQGGKKLFEQKITHVFRVASSQIRRQANYVRWSEMNVLQLMRPQLVLDTVKGVIQQADFRNVFDMIRSFSTIPMARLIESSKNIPIQRLIYIIKCLQQKGLIQQDEDSIKLSLMTDFFQKATFRVSGQNKQN